ncbi:helix-turn-helix domain-containing protein [Nocardia yamanashiensis]|uniref:helix-turn-helix domain-containing protein n=1 Tax=Nocardia yamanashiensis TaxID=209247 RepID=UPI0008313132|nr:helix-turn-helix transcriptional regulator [Nocardia yamanashiensis]
MADRRHVATLRSQWLGQRLREQREAAGITVAEAAEYLGVKGNSTMSRYETGAVPLRWTDVDALLTMYGVADAEQREELIALAKEAWRKGWWDEYRDVVGSKRYLDVFWLESRAAHIRIFSLGLLNGLLQSPAYMNELFREDPALDDASAARAAELRLARQRMVSDAATTVTAIVHETVLRQRTSNPEAMREQLNHLLEIGKNPRIVLRVLPFDRFLPRALASSFALFDLGEQFGPVGYVENLAGCLCVETPVVDRYLDTYAELEEAALSQGDSATLIEQAIEV